jgi:hypothetical protein
VLGCAAREAARDVFPGEIVTASTRILTILGIALLLRVLLPLASTLAVGNKGVFLFPDSTGYIKPAEELLHSGRFANGDSPEFTRTPGYPVFLLPGILLGKLVLVTVAFQVAVSLLTVWLVYRITVVIFAPPRLRRSCILWSRCPSCTPR